MAKRVSLFVTCIVDQLFPRVGMAMAGVLERIGCPSRLEIHTVANDLSSVTVAAAARIVSPSGP